jgi:DNA-binding MarR family transcriptional regulator
MASEVNRRHLALEVRRALRQVNNQLALLSHRVGTKADLKDIDLGTMDYLSQHGPLSATAIARGVGIHPATLTGVLDRLERGGWIVRERDAEDRRSVVIRVDPKRNADMFALYEGMNSRMDALLTDFSEEQLETIVTFLERTAAAGSAATDELNPR